MSGNKVDCAVTVRGRELIIGPSNKKASLVLVGVNLNLVPLLQKRKGWDQNRRSKSRRRTRKEWLVKY